MRVITLGSAQNLRAVSSEKQIAKRANGRSNDNSLNAVRPRIGGPRRVQIRREEEGGYAARCPSLPGCYSQGETRAEALANINEAIDLHLEVMRENNLGIPPGLEFS